MSDVRSSKRFIILNMNLVAIFHWLNMPVIVFSTLRRHFEGIAFRSYFILPSHHRNFAFHALDGILGKDHYAVIFVRLSLYSKYSKYYIPKSTMHLRARWCRSQNIGERD